ARTAIVPARIPDDRSRAASSFVAAGLPRATTPSAPLSAAGAIRPRRAPRGVPVTVVRRTTIDPWTSVACNGCRTRHVRYSHPVLPLGADPPPSGDGSPLESSPAFTGAPKNDTAAWRFRR